MCHFSLVGKIVLNADFLSKGAIHRSFSKGLVEGPSLGIKTSKADTPMLGFLPPLNTIYRGVG